MDIRRPHPQSRPTGPPSRRMFNAHPPSRRPHPHHPSSLSTTSLHIPAEEADPKDDMVERDGSGNYSMAAPMTAVAKRESSMVKSEGDEEVEQENEFIALYAKPPHHYDDKAEKTFMENIKAALENSLEKKVMSLENDRWMFEGEGKSKG